MNFRYILILVVAALVLLTVYGGEERTATRFSESREMIVLRKIGHELLLHSGDHSSRILPLKQVSDEEFRLFFENPLSLLPDTVVNIVNRIMVEYKLRPDFTTNIIRCQDKETVYGFLLSNSGNDNIVPCLGRKLPTDCYYLSFIFSTPKEKGSKQSYYIGAALVLLMAFLYVARKRNPKMQADPVPENNESNQAASFTRIGNYLFQFEQQYLELNGERTALTVKESRLLTILAANPNVMVERKALQKEVWENEGVIVTRSLDMFMSKLRKKMAGDATVRILNIHGKGYKLEVPS